MSDDESTNSDSGEVDFVDPTTDDSLGLDEEPSSAEATIGVQESAVPDKFKDKSLEEVIESYTNLEKEYGRKNNEVGELRKLADQLLEIQTKSVSPDSGGNTSHHHDDEEENDIDFWDDPQKALNQSLENNPTIKELESYVQTDKATKSLEKLKEHHSDYEKVLNDSHFASWLNENPTRAKLLQEANVNYDPDLAAEIISLYKLNSGDYNTDTTNDDLRKAQVENSTSTPTAKQGKSKKKYYRRADLLKLRMQNPEKYHSMYEEIAAAYKEGRVK